MSETVKQRHAIVALPKSTTAPLKAVEAAAKRLGSLDDLPEEHHSVAVATALSHAYHGTLVGAYGAGGEVHAEIIALGVGNFVAGVMQQFEDEADYEIVTRMLFSAIIDREGHKAAATIMRMMSEDAPAHGNA